MGVKVQARVESTLKAPAKVAPAQRASVSVLGGVPGQGVVYQQAWLPRETSAKF